MLINKETLVQISEYDFRKLHPETFFPVMLSDDAISETGHAILHYDVARPTPALYQKVISTSVQVLEGKYQEIWELTDMTDEEKNAVDLGIQTDIVNQTQARLDRFAQTRGYDNVDSTSKYNGSKNPRYASDFKTISDACSDTWDALYAYQVEVEAGIKPKPGGYADVELLLPALAWPDTSN